MKVLKRQHETVLTNLDNAIDLLDRGLNPKEHLKVLRELVTLWREMEEEPEAWVLEQRINELRDLQVRFPRGGR